jgi:hypothetical protein
MSKQGTVGKRRHITLKVVQKLEVRISHFPFCALIGINYSKLEVIMRLESGER